MVGEVQPLVHHRYFILNPGQINFHPDSFPQFQELSFTNTFFNSINPIVEIHYTYLFGNFQTSLFWSNFIQYYERRLLFEINPLSLSNTYLESNLTGELFFPYSTSLSWRYMAILADSTLFGNYVRATTIERAMNSSESIDQRVVETPLPLIFTSTSNIQIMPFIRDLRLIWNRLD